MVIINQKLKLSNRNGIKTSQIECLNNRSLSDGRGQVASPGLKVTKLLDLESFNKLRF